MYCAMCHTEIDVDIDEKFKQFRDEIINANVILGDVYLYCLCDTCEKSLYANEQVGLSIKFTDDIKEVMIDGREKVL